MLWDGKTLSVLSEYNNELEALVANELLSPAQPMANLQSTAGGLTPSFLSSSRPGQTPNLQEALAQLMAQASRLSPASTFSPLGSLLSPSLQALLSTPRDAQNQAQLYLQSHEQRMVGTRETQTCLVPLSLLLL